VNAQLTQTSNAALTPPPGTSSQSLPTRTDRTALT